jgi:hypothetical protein
MVPQLSLGLWEAICARSSAHRRGCNIPHGVYHNVARTWRAPGSGSGGTLLLGYPAQSMSQMLLLSSSVLISSEPVEVRHKMLHEVLLGIGPVPVVVGILLLLVAAFKHRFPPKSANAEIFGSDPETLLLPQMISSNIPYIGHVLGYVRGGHSYFSSLW